MEPIYWMLGVLLFIAIFCAVMTMLAAKDRSKLEQSVIDDLFDSRSD